jgi:hypothetical protein
MMSTETTTQEIAEILGEPEERERPHTQIAAVIDVLGEQAVLELLAETQRVEDAGGMLVSGGGDGAWIPGGGAVAAVNTVVHRRARAGSAGSAVGRGMGPSVTLWWLSPIGDFGSWEKMLQARRSSGRHPSTDLPRGKVQATALQRVKIRRPYNSLRSCCGVKKKGQQTSLQSL